MEDVHQRIRDGFYEVEATYPESKPKKPKLNGKGYEEIDAMTLEIHEGKMLRYKDQLALYRREQGSKMDTFRADALEYCGLTDHPKADKIYSYAWEKGHSAGYGEVLMHLEELAELFED